MLEHAGANIFSLQVFWATGVDLSFVTTGGSEKTLLNQISGLLIPSSAEQSYQSFPSTTTCFPFIVLEALMVTADVVRARQTTSRTRTTHAYVWKLLAISDDSVLSKLPLLPSDFCPLDTPSHHQLPPLACGT